jgi:hypothetical protein
MSEPEENKRPWLRDVQKVSHAIAQKNREDALNYLFKWRYTSFDILKLNAGIKATSGGQFIKKMIEQKLITKVFVPTLKKEALTLTGAGLAVAADSALAEAEKHTSYLRIPSTQARHHLYVQRVMLNRKTGATEIHPENPLPHVDEDTSHQKVTDVMYMKNMAWHAVEVELVRKSTPKIMVAYDAFAQAINYEQISEVEYVFAHEAVHRLYVELFNKPEWQLYKWDARSKQYKPTTKTPVASRIREKFKFTLEKHVYD